MSALGQKQTLQHLQKMSALPPKADIALHRSECPLCAKSGHSAAQQNARRAPGKFGGLHTMLGVPLSCGGDLSEFDDRRNLRLSSRLPARRCKPN